MPQITLLTGPERRRRWSDDDRRRILTAAFAADAIVANISRQFDVSTSLIYKWRRQALAGEAPAAFAPGVVLRAPPPPAPPEMTAPEMTAIVVELSNGVRLKIGSHASAALVTATLRALR
jgi:transposase